MFAQTSTFFIKHQKNANYFPFACELHTNTPHSNLFICSTIWWSCPMDLTGKFLLKYVFFHQKPNHENATFCYDLKRKCTKEKLIFFIH